MCVECEDQEATLRCTECDDIYCDPCFEFQHRKGRRASHSTKRLREGHDAGEEEAAAAGAASKLLNEASFVFFL